MKKLIAITLLTGISSVAVLANTVLNEAVHIKPVGVAPQIDIQAPGHRPKIEVVFVLDTTSSMSNLIESAKQQIWSIATTLASGDPAPLIKMGLIGFRDKQDDYVTKVFPLSDDLDTLYAHLMDFEAQGGGDAPEHVNQALFEAVNQMSWSQDERTYRTIFLVGDAPAHEDYADSPQWPDIAKLAKSRGITLNTVLAGNDGAASAQFRQIAALAGGDYLTIGQNVATLTATPFDDQIAKLSYEMDDTRVFFGDVAERKALEAKSESTRKIYASAPAAALASRADYNASEAGLANFTAGKDLVDAYQKGRVDLEVLPATALPSEMQAMSLEERQTELTQKAEKRKSLEKDLKILTEQRQAYLDKNAKEDGAAGLNPILETAKAQAGASAKIVY
ncbi:MAG: VWA domain-containing protein [Hahellaceae bacterium]|jgi:Mg-chelatase subunit ChlD|nr:VWA domain-containing protein [Hahellaceae bacterium]